MKSENNKLPVEEVLPRLKKALAENNICILAAPPGAGKTTVVPVALMDEEWLEDRKIIMLEPRRIAARRSAEYMSSQRKEKCGQSIGYRIRTESCISRETRIEVVTEGILTRMLQSDPEMPEAGLVIFDEFHERSIHADTGLAFLLDVQKNLRPDIKILIMSATPDIQKLSLMLDKPPIVESSGRAYPVETHYLRHTSEKRLEIRTAEAVLGALKKEEGDILTFLPGKKEIKRTAELLIDRFRGSDVILHELYGEASRQEQEAALSPAPSGRRKVILSTSIAETSLTIDGVRIVIDSGLSRISSFEVRRGMPGLVTVPVSKASADQRRGRAGRQSPGVCYRLWTKEEEEFHPPFTQPEILSADLASLALELAEWGVPEAEGLLFLDPPPKANLAQARSILFMLGALDKGGKLTHMGKQMTSLPVHPRLSAMILRAQKRGLEAEACLLASLLEETVGQGKREINLNERWHMLQNPKDERQVMQAKRIYVHARRLMKIIRASEGKIEGENLGLLLALAYPERVAVKRSVTQYQLAQGTMASIPDGDPMSKEEFLAVAEADAAGAVAKVFLAAPITRNEILENFREVLSSEETVEWEAGTVKGKRKIKLGSISIQEKEFTPEEEEIEKALLSHLRSEGISLLPWDKESRNLIERSEWLRLYVADKNDPAFSNWPVLSEENMTAMMEEWLKPFLHGLRRQKDVELLDMKEIIKSVFSYEQMSMLDRLAPASIKVPGGSSIRLRYDEGEKPVLAVRLQELFGQVDTPRIGGGKIPVLIHLLSPAMRPLAITQDLRSFWANTYPGILKQMRIKYPKHVWPDDPLKAEATNKTRRGNTLR
ncbi:MAG: ATP-dependent helicase HrpB [Ignavibacteria bacterium]|jgi:ATP-dependent helicase HrpB|nr:ATP-dependent helicase HrpB [Ignavibacteria bacterium]MCU7502088.1 ATP-dependent helicase HrpB [Ignavibacteria bacterium]MCU7515490.1 ATP-dependent helicase HrpB [Ignavibacteria bacterium]